MSALPDNGGEALSGLGGVPATRTIAGLDLSADRTAAATQTALGLDARIAAGGTAPLLWLKCDEPAGASTLVNSGSTSAADATLTSAIAGQNGPWGDPGVQVRSGGYAQLPVNKVAPTTITVALWFRQSAQAAARLAVRSYGTTWVSPYTSVGIYIDSAGLMSASVNTSATERVANAVASTVVRAGQWHFVALTYDATTVSLYVDGYLQGTTTTTGVIDYGGTPASTRWNFGGNPVAAAEYLIGEMSDIRVYTAAQTAAWVAQTYKRGRRSYDGS